MNSDQDWKRWDFDNVDQEIEITHQTDICARIHQGCRSPPNLNVGGAVVLETKDLWRANNMGGAIHDGRECRKVGMAEDEGSDRAGGRRVMVVWIQGEFERGGRAVRTRWVL